MKKLLKNFSIPALSLASIIAVGAITLPLIVNAQIPSNSCGWSEIGCGLQNFLIFLMNILLKLGSLLTGLGGMILDGAVFYTIVQMSESYRGINAISEGWGVLRDVANMGFIFLLLYAAIKTILGLGGDVRKLIRNVVIVAILLNFSLFFTSVVIDAANIMALFFYDAIAGSSTATTWQPGTGISAQFMQLLNLQSNYNFQGNLDTGPIVVLGIMGFIMTIITAFIFFAAGLMFITRYAVLILVLILSPIAFVSFALPGLNNIKDRWVKALIGQSFFAPVYFLLIWISMRVLSGIMSSFGAPAANSFANLANVGVSGGTTVAESVGTFSLFINFIVVIIFLIASLIIAKDVANKAGGAVASVNKWAGGIAGAATFGLAARGGRLAAAGLTPSPDSERYKRLEAKSAEKGFGGAMARLRLGAIDKTRSSAFDIRDTRLGGIMAGAGLEMGEAGGKGGIEADKKAVREFLARPGTESRRKRDERATTAQRHLDIMAGEEASKIPDATRTSQQKTAIDKMEVAISKTSDKEIEAVVNANKGLLKNQEFANKLSAKQLEAIIKNNAISKEDKKDLIEVKFAPIKAGLESAKIPENSRNPAQIEAIKSMSKAVKKMSGAELEMIDKNNFNNIEFVSRLKSTQVDTLSDSNEFTREEKDALKKIRVERLLNAVKTNNTGAAEKEINNLGHKEIADLDIKALTSKAMIESYTPKILKRIEPELTTANITEIRKAIIDAATTPGNDSKRVMDLAKWLETDSGKNAF